MSSFVNTIFNHTFFSLRSIHATTFSADDPKKPFRDVAVDGVVDVVDVVVVDLVLGVNAVVEPLEVIAAAATSRA